MVSIKWDVLKRMARQYRLNFLRKSTKVELVNNLAEYYFRDFEITRAG